VLVGADNLDIFQRLAVVDNLVPEAVRLVDGEVVRLTERAVADDSLQDLVQLGLALSLARLELGELLFKARVLRRRQVAVLAIARVDRMLVTDASKLLLQNSLHVSNPP
jgi:hypothetical protein